MKKVLGLLGTLALVCALTAASVGTASAAEGDPIGFCAGTEVSGTVVAVDETLNLITIDTGEGALCNVQLNGQWEHPITQLLGSYFADVSLESLSAALDALSVQFACDSTSGEEICELSGEGGTAATVLSITQDAEGNYLVEVAYQTPEGEQTKTLSFTGSEQELQAWLDALAALNVSWQLGVDESGNPVVSEAGDDIAAYHAEGWGFGQLVKVYSIASEAQEACAGDAEASMEDGPDFCSVTVASLMEAFQSGGGWGAIFKEYGKPALLGVGHVRNAAQDRNTPPANACGYWAKQDEGPALAQGESDPCANFKQKDNGKPEWAGSPGGKPKDDDPGE